VDLLSFYNKNMGRPSQQLSPYDRMAGSSAIFTIPWRTGVSVILYTLASLCYTSYLIMKYSLALIFVVGYELFCA